MWQDISVRQFIQLYDIELNPNLFLIEKQVKMLSVLEGKDEQHYDTIKYRELLELVSEKTKFYDVLPQAKPVDYLYVNGNKYKFIHEIDEITAGQFIDISHYGNNMMEINMAAACFFRPVVNKKVLKYGAVPHKIISEDLLDAKFIDVYGCLVFFYQLLLEFTSNTLFSSELTKRNRDKIMTLIKDGAGFGHPN
jgi:hypothetical protein